MKWLLTGMVAVALALLPGVAAADDGEDDFLLRINGDVTVAKGETVNTVFVINGNANIEGTADTVVVIHGSAIVSGTVARDLNVVDGTADLRSGATVQDVNVVNGSFEQAQGATVNGNVNERAEFDISGDLSGIATAFSVYFWIAITVILIVMALVFAAIGGRQLTDAARAMTGDLAGSIVGGVAVWIALPVLAGLLLFTIVAIPLSLGVFFVVLPALWSLGYIVAGTRLGSVIVKFKDSSEGSHPYIAAVLGVILLQAATLVPVIGWLVASVAGFWGAGALALIAFRAARGRPPQTMAPAVQM